MRSTSGPSKIDRVGYCPKVTDGGAHLFHFIDVLVAGWEESGADVLLSSAIVQGPTRLWMRTEFAFPSCPTSIRQEAILRLAAKTVPTKKDTAMREQTSQAAITSFLVTK